MLWKNRGLMAALIVLLIVTGCGGGSPVTDTVDGTTDTGTVQAGAGLPSLDDIPRQSDVINGD